MSDLAAVMSELAAFRDARDWAQFHTPRNLAAAIAVEAAELQETMLWKDEEEVEAMLIDPDRRQRIADELADVLLYTLGFFQLTGMDPLAEARRKLEQNAAKYPVEKSRGRADKYTDL